MTKWTNTIELSSYPSAEDLKTSLHIHHKLKTALNLFETMDPVDALKDAELLVAACFARLERD